MKLDAQQVVIAKDESGMNQGYCFQSIYWRKFDVKMINLTHVIRQSDVEFCSALDSCKMGGRMLVQ